MKKFLLFALTVLALFSCSKDVDIYTPDYVWVEGDSIRKQYFIMSVATIYPDSTDSTGKAQILSCQVTLGDTSVKGALGTRLEMEMSINNKTDGTYSVGNGCSGTVSHFTCFEGKGDSVSFKKDTYTLKSGSLQLENSKVNNEIVNFTLDLVGERKVPVVSEGGDTTYITPTVKLTGDFVAKR